MAFKYIQFRDAVSIGGDFSAVSSWRADPHGRVGIEPSISGQFLVLTIPGRGVRRVPMSNVVFMDEDDLAVAEPKGAKVKP